MAKNTLVEADKEAGDRITRAIDAADLDLQAALWFYSPDSNGWRLLISTPLVDTEGPKKVYSKIQKTIGNILEQYQDNISLQDISLISPSHNLIATLRSAVTTGGNIGNIRFTGNVINNVLVEDALIYKI